MKLYGTRRLFGKPEPVFSFDPALATFTPGMAKRAGTVFAAAPMVQGNWDGSGTPDLLSFARGNDIMPVGLWYDQFDPYQGGGFGDWVPEQSSADRADSNHAYIWWAAGGYHLRY